MDKSRFINQILPTRTYFGPKKRNSVSVVSVTIFDRRSFSPDTIHLYYISFYLQSHRFHTKHVLIYSCIEEKKGKDNTIGTKCNTMCGVRTKYERITHTACA